MSSLRVDGRLLLLLLALACEVDVAFFDFLEDAFGDVEDDVEVDFLLLPLPVVVLAELLAPPLETFFDEEDLLVFFTGGGGAAAGDDSGRSIRGGSFRTSSVGCSSAAAANARAMASGFPRGLADEE